MDEEARAVVIQNPGEGDSDVQSGEEEEEAPSGELKISEYDYLLSMPLWSLSEEKVAELNLSS